MKQPDVDAEKLAALMDGRLDERERAELLARLASSQDSLEVFADAAAAVSEAESGEAKVVPLPSLARQTRRWHLGDRRWLAVAAIIAGVAVVGPIIRSRLRSVESDPGRFVTLLNGGRSGLPEGWDGSPWTTVRGGEGEPLTPTERAARIGARIVDLELAVRAGDTAAARLANDVATLLDGVPAGAPVAAMYREVEQGAGASPENLESLLRRARIAAGEQAGPELVELGAWTEAARVAAARRDGEFFRHRDSRDVIGRALAVESLPQGADARLRKLQETLGLPLRDWSALESQLADIARLLGG